MKKLFYLFLLIGPFILCAQKDAYPLTGIDENGQFRLLVNNSELATIDYKLDAHGNYQRSFKLTMAGQSVDYKLGITAGPQGAWQTMDITVPTETVHVTREQNKAVFKSQDQAYSVSLQEKSVIYDNYGPALETFFLKAYDLEAGGVQKFSRFIIPARFFDMELQFKNRQLRKTTDREESVLFFEAGLSGLAIQIWADEQLKVLMVHVPMQRATFIRQGYDSLLEAIAEDPLVSKPVYALLRRTEMVPMRDGVKLATDLYLPQGTETEKYPLVLIRTPYKKEMMEMEANFYGRRGYAVAIQDCRGRFASEGVWVPFFNESRDGYDAIEWLAVQPWSNGKVGMVGGSYVGWVQLWAAVEKPPHLVTIIPNVAPPDPFYNIPYEYGSFFIFGSIWWAEILESEATGDLSGKAMSKINERRYEKILKRLPVVDLDKEIFGKVNPYWRQWIEHNRDGGFWSGANFMDKLSGLDLPVFLQSGWFDGDGIGSKLNYARLRASRNRFQKLILGPWGHTDQASSRIGDHEFGKEAAPDLKIMYLKWFDYWLKGIDNNILEEPLVQIFVMFSNQWLTGDTYPLPQTKFTKLYLGSRRGANTSRGDGRLAWETLPDGKDFDSYLYDPGDPTPHPEWIMKSDSELKKEKKRVIDSEAEKKRMAAFHNQVTDKRRDILVYQTMPLDKPLTIAGPVSAVIHAASSAPDTDWFVTLMDVDEQGEIFPLVHGTLRARFRNSLEKPELLEINKIYTYDIDMWQTGITFQKGHRIRVEVASALFPMFSRNLNTGGHNEKETRFRKASQRVYHSDAYPSHILLPVIDMAKK
ncbi:MAG: CocE/NonD family hydrolase [Candidatus Aminicenantes bacterium]|nr:CocE/NonD family hydrolase [Candidatus Aminicenantes bacterium]